MQQKLTAYVAFDIHQSTAYLKDLTFIHRISIYYFTRMKS